MRDWCAKQSMGPRKSKNGSLRRIRLRPKAGLRRTGVLLAMAGWGRIQLYWRLSAHRHGSIFSRHGLPEVYVDVVPRKQEGAGNAGARCTRGLVCKLHKEMGTRAYRFSGGSPAFPAQWLYGLYRALGERIRLVTVAAGLMGNRIRSDRCRHRQLGTSNGCRDHTVLPYAESAVVLRAG
jgi:hypothetical protein